MRGAQLVFHEAVRGAPSLHRGWRTPDPSPTRGCADLPGCAHGAGEWVEEPSHSGAALSWVLEGKKGAGLWAQKSQLKVNTSMAKDLEEQSTPRGHEWVWSATERPSEEFADNSTALEFADNGTTAALAIRRMGSSPRSSPFASGCSTPTTFPEERCRPARWAELESDSDSTPRQYPEKAAAAAPAAPLAPPPSPCRQGAAQAQKQLPSMPPGVWAQPSCPPHPVAAFPAAFVVAAAAWGAGSAVAPVQALLFPVMPPPAPFVETEQRATLTAPASPTTPKATGAGAVEPGLAAELEVPVCLSAGSVGHPHTCADACKFAWKRRGCKDGSDCNRCHLCVWRKTGTRYSGEASAVHQQRS